MDDVFGADITAGECVDDVVVNVQRCNRNEDYVVASPPSSYPLAQQLV